MTTHRPTLRRRVPNRGDATERPRVPRLDQRRDRAAVRARAGREVADTTGRTNADANATDPTARPTVGDGTPSHTQ